MGEAPATIPFGGMHIMPVDPGTVVTDERTGERATITDTSFAVKGRVMWVTHATYEAMKAALPSPASAEGSR